MKADKIFYQDLYFEKKNLLNILKIKEFHFRGLYEVLSALFFFSGLISLLEKKKYLVQMLPYHIKKK